MRTVKIRQSSYEKIQALLAQIAEHGWASLGRSRTDPATLATVVDAALDCLSGLQSQPGRKPRRR